MPFLRFSRDKRGYDHTYLIHPVSDRRGRSRPRILYWFRTPPNVKVGREMLDDQIVRALEAQYPDVTFDWVALRKTSLAPPEPEPWRERRRAQRAARQLRQAEEPELEAGSEDGGADEGETPKPTTSAIEVPLAETASMMSDVSPGTVLEQVVEVGPPLAVTDRSPRRSRQRRGRGRRHDRRPGGN